MPKLEKLHEARKRIENIDKISLYVTTHSGSDHVLDIPEGSLNK